MAITKVYAVRNHLHRIVSYATNEQKTELNGIIEYAVNPDKTEKRLFECAINCRSVITTYDEMQSTKSRWKKTNGVLAYHFIQSFAPGETTPQQAHQIGIEFAKQCFGDKYEVVIGTHLDKHHLHNHIVVNSVSFIDGKKYHSSPESYYNNIRATSDRLCVENDLSVITSKGKGKHYAEWKAEKDGKPTIRSQIRQEVDEIIKDSYTFKTFIELLQKRGYTVKYGERVKYIAIKPHNSQKFIRLKSLGENYTGDNIKLRLEAQRNGIRQLDTPDKMPPKRYKLAKGILNSIKPRKIKGFVALYLHYLYLLGKVKKRKAPKKVSFLMREDVIKFERYQKQFRFLFSNNIETTADLANIKNDTEVKMNSLISNRENLYPEKKAADTNEQKTNIQNKISDINTQLRKLRKVIKMCDNIEIDVTVISEKLNKNNEITQREQKLKEAKINEHKWRGSRFDG